MSKALVLVGTKKGAFILTSDGKRQEWKVSGPHFAGWEVYHLKGGILGYLEGVPEAESRWRGECFVFDERIALGHGLREHPKPAQQEGAGDE